MYTLPTTITSLYLLLVYKKWNHYCIKIWSKIASMPEIATRSPTYLIKSDFLMHLNQTWNSWVLVVAQATTGQYWWILDNITQCLTILGNIWQYWSISERSLHHHNSDKSDLKKSLERYWTILDNILPYWVILNNNR